MLLEPSNDLNETDRDNDLKECVYNTGDILAITIAPDNTCQRYCHKNRYPLFYQEYIDLTTKIFPPKLFEYEFRIELSEPVGKEVKNGPRLHLHGYVKLNKKASVFHFLLNSMPMMLGHNLLSIKHINEVDKLKGWYNYMDKQKAYMPSQSVISNYVDTKELRSNLLDYIALIE